MLMLSTDSRLCRQRAGVTLTEVLVALFIMAIGILALLSLFPLGALQMAQAVKDDRTGTLATNADATARIFWRKAWQSTSNAGDIETNESGMGGVFSIEPAFALLDNGTTKFSTGSSNPVLIDPIGIHATAGLWMGTTSVNTPLPNNIPRQNWAAVTASNTATAAVRMCSVLDDMTFDSTGQPDTSNLIIDRGGRYSVAWLLQRPINNVRHEVNLTILVYQNRPVYAPFSQEYVLSATVAGPTSVAIPTNAVANNGFNPNLKKGGWIMDVSIPSQPGFYRIVSYDFSSGMVELQLPLQSYGSANPRFMILDNLVEVFNRGTISAFGTPMQQ